MNSALHQRSSQLQKQAEHLSCWIPAVKYRRYGSNGVHHRFARLKLC